MSVKVGINGFGRIGRNILRAGFKNPNIEFVAINDLFPTDTLAHLLKHDSTLGQFDADVKTTENSLIINGKEIKVTKEKDPALIPWGKLGVDIVIESTGIFTNADQAKKHLEAGAKKVIISAPAKGDDLTIVLGVNDDKYDTNKHNIVSNASCTTNCLAPVAKVINDTFGIVHGSMTTVHSYTNDQKILDLPHKDLRRARSAALSIIPTSTGAAKAIGLVIPELNGKMDGIAMRVPTPNVSVVDLVAEVKSEATTQQLLDALKKAAAGKMKGVLEISEEPLVSKDFNGNPASSIVDAELCQVLDKKLVKVVSWYDNEWGYSNRCVDLAVFMGNKLGSSCKTEKAGCSK